MGRKETQMFGKGRTRTESEKSGLWAVNELLKHLGRRFKFNFWKCWKVVINGEHVGRLYFEAVRHHGHDDESILVFMEEGMGKWWPDNAVVTYIENGVEVKQAFQFRYNAGASCYDENTIVAIEEIPKQEGRDIHVRIPTPVGGC